MTLFFKAPSIIPTAKLGLQFLLGAAAVNAAIVYQPFSDAARREAARREKENQSNTSELEAPSHNQAPRSNRP